jgi:hypothetical protein
MYRSTNKQHGILQCKFVSNIVALDINHNIQIGSNTLSQSFKSFPVPNHCTMKLCRGVEQSGEGMVYLCTCSPPLRDDVIQSVTLVHPFSNHIISSVSFN